MISLFGASDQVYSSRHKIVPMNHVSNISIIGLIDLLKICGMDRHNYPDQLVHWQVESSTKNIDVFFPTSANIEYSRSVKANPQSVYCSVGLLQILLTLTNKRGHSLQKKTDT